MRVLDIDLDFFLDNVAYSYYRDGHGLDRLDEELCNPWTIPEVKDFLETQCGLSTENLIPGSYFIHHDAVFYFWRELIQSGQLRRPFDVVHIDTHSDTGNGDASYVYIMSELLHMPVDKRMYPKEDKVGAGNYLAFALACQWISSVTFVTPHKRINDLCAPHCENFAIESDYFQLRKYTAEQVKELLWRMFENPPEPLDVEPSVPYRIVSSEDFHSNGNYSFISLTQSPSFTPQNSDELIPIIMEYMEIGNPKP